MIAAGDSLTGRPWDMDNARNVINTIAIYYAGGSVDVPSWLRKDSQAERGIN